MKCQLTVQRGCLIIPERHQLLDEREQQRGRPVGASNRVMYTLLSQTQSCSTANILMLVPRDH